MNLGAYRWDTKDHALIGLGFFLAIWVVLCNHLFGIGIELFLPFAALSLLLVSFRTDLVLLLTLFSSVFVVYNKSGLDIGELAYYGLLGLTILMILLPMMLEGRLQVVHPNDRWIVFIYIALFLGLMNGILTIRSIRAPLQELVFYYSAFLFYFPLRRYLHLKTFRVGMGIVTSTIAAYVVFRTFNNYRTSLLAAVADWELNFIRGAGNENILLISLLLTVALYLIHTTKWVRNTALLISMVIMGAILVTLTRSLWAVSFFGLLILFFSVESVAKWRVIKMASVVVSLLFLVGIVFFNDYLQFALTIVINRITMTTAGGPDLSLIERIRETKSAFLMIMQNPILGPGLGVAYLRENLFQRIAEPSIYIHNGYLAVWYKFGLIGLISFVALLGSIFRHSVHVFKSHTNPAWQAFALATATYVAMAALMNITSPVFLTYEGILVLTLLGAVIAHLQTRSSGR